MQEHRNVSFSVLDCCKGTTLEGLKQVSSYDHFSIVAARKFNWSKPRALWTKMVIYRENIVVCKLYLVMTALVLILIFK